MLKVRNFLQKDRRMKFRCTRGSHCPKLGYVYQENFNQHLEKPAGGSHLLSLLVPVSHKTKLYLQVVSSADISLACTD